jgi:hypothetical protein
MQKALLNVSDSNLISQIIDKLLAKSTLENSKDDFSSILEQLLKNSPQSQTKIDINSKKFLSALDELINKQHKNTQVKNLSKNTDSTSSDLLYSLFLIQNNNTVSNFQNQTNTSETQKTFNQTFKDIKELAETIKAQSYSGIQQDTQNYTNTKNIEVSKVSEQINSNSNTQDLQPDITNGKILAQITKKTSDEKIFGAGLQKAILQNNKQPNTQLIDQTQDSKKQNQQESTSNKQATAIQITKNTIATDVQAPSNKTDSFNAELKIDNQTPNEYSLDQKQQIAQQTTMPNEKQNQQNSSFQSKQSYTNDTLSQLKPQTQPTKNSAQESANVSRDLSNTKEPKAASSNIANSSSQNNNYNDSSNAQENKPQNQNLQNQNANQPQQKFAIDNQTTKTLFTQETQSKQLQTQDTLQSAQELDKSQKQLSQDTNNNLNQNTITQAGIISFQKISDTQNTNAPKQPYPINQIIEKIIELQNLKPPVIKSITIQVNPPSLGQIDVKVSIDAAKSLTATIHVENQEIFNLVNNNLDSLKANISQQGLNVSQINVVSSSNLGQQNFTQNQNQQNQNQSLFQFSQNFNQSSSGQGQNSFNQAFNQQKQQNYVFESTTKQIKRIFKNPKALLDISI